MEDIVINDLISLEYEIVDAHPAVKIMCGDDSSSSREELTVIEDYSGWKLSEIFAACDNAHNNWLENQ